MKKVLFINSANKEEKSINCKCCCNFVTLKKLLAEKIKTDPRKIQIRNDEKMSIVNDNELVPIDQDRFFYLIDNVNARNIVTLKVNENYFGIPEFIEVNQNSSIQELKNILFQYSNEQSKMFLFDGNGILLDDAQTVFGCNLFDYCKIYVWRGNDLLVKVNIYAPFLNRCFNESSSMKFSVTEKISDIKNQISRNLKLGEIGKVALFTDSYYLRNDKCLVDYPLQNEGSNLYFVDLIKSEEIRKGQRKTKCKYYKLFIGEFGQIPVTETVAICQYSIGDQLIEDKKILKYEIISRLLLCNDSRFVQLIAMHEEDRFFFIITQYLEKGSVKSLYKASPLPNNIILHYSTQICDALKFMHDKKLIHRMLTCSSALVDSNNDIKLTNFHLTKYLRDYSTEELLIGIPGSIIDIKKCWLSPEVLREEIYGFKSDVWLFGATMIEMVTRNRPYPDMNVLRAINEIINNHGIEFDQNIFPELTNIIHHCLQSLPNNRPTSEECLQLLHNLNIDH